MGTRNFRIGKRDVQLRAVTNAAYEQKAKVEIYNERNGQLIQTYEVRGQGEKNNPMYGAGLDTCGTLWIPASSDNRKAKVQTWWRSSSSSSWKEHALHGQSAQLDYASYCVLFSEDSTDNDYNDCVLTFIWWHPKGDL